jgi:uncharacterized protein YecA (UPF0149 family)
LIGKEQIETMKEFSKDKCECGSCGCDGHKQDVADVVKKKYPISQPVTKHNNIGRNDKCPCGSGKKYKKCCLLKRTYTIGG